MAVGPTAGTAAGATSEVGNSDALLKQMRADSFQTKLDVAEQKRIENADTVFNAGVKTAEAGRAGFERAIKNQ